MKPEEIELYREIQKNSEDAMKVIDMIREKVYEDDFALQISRQELKYSDIRNRAVSKLLKAKAEPRHPNYISDFVLKGGIQLNTALNTSTSHIAEVMIRENNRGITNICKAVNRNQAKDSFSVELAKEFIGFEEKNIAIYKKYL